MYIRTPSCCHTMSASPVGELRRCTAWVSFEETLPDGGWLVDSLHLRLLQMDCIHGKPMTDAAGVQSPPIPALFGAPLMGSPCCGADTFSRGALLSKASPQGSFLPPLLSHMSSLHCDLKTLSTFPCSLPFILHPDKSLAHQTPSWHLLLRELKLMHSLCHFTGNCPVPEIRGSDAPLSEHSDSPH